MSEENKIVKKIKEAEELVSQKKLSEALTIYRELCSNTLFTPTDKILVIKSMFNVAPDEGMEMVIRFRDILNIVKESQSKETRDIVTLLSLICKEKNVNSHERMITAVTLYNYCFLQHCYSAFEDIANDENVDLEYRVDCCKYLFASDQENLKEISKNVISKLISDEKFSSEKRYSIICGFTTKSGIKTFTNTTKLMVPYDESFVYPFQNSFFHFDRNGIRERILSGQHLICMKCIEQKQKIDIVNKIIEFAADESFPIEVRGDAADVVLRLGITQEQKLRARILIKELGLSGVDRKSENIIDRIRTIYTDAMNMHDETIEECVVKYIEKMIGDPDTVPMEFEKVSMEIGEMIRSKNVDSETKHKAKKSLNRVNIDTATFTSYAITMKEILVYIWMKIKNYQKTQRQTLEERLIQELIDMGDTCSSGFAGRLVNVLSGVEAELRISFGDQIIANIAGRMTARIKNIKDEDLRASITMGMMDDAEEEDKNNYNKFIEENMIDLRKELYKEFVGEKYVSEKEFETYFQEGQTRWKET